MISELLIVFEHELKVLLASILPVVEVRGAIPIGLAYNMNIYHAASLSFLGSLLPVPLILLGGRRLFRELSRWRPLRDLANRYVQKTKGRYEKVYHKFGSWALLVFVALPFPGTGVWTGSLIASLLRLRIRWAVPAIIIGNAIATALIAASIYGVQRVIN